MAGTFTESTNDEGSILAEEVYAQKLYYGNLDAKLSLYHLNNSGTVQVYTGSFTDDSSVMSVTSSSDHKSVMTIPYSSITQSLSVPGLSNFTGAALFSSISSTNINIGGNLYASTITSLIFSANSADLATITANQITSAGILSGSALQIGGGASSISSDLNVSGSISAANLNILSVANFGSIFASGSISGRNIIATSTLSSSVLNISGPYASIAGNLDVGRMCQAGTVSADTGTFPNLNCNAVTIASSTISAPSSGITVFFQNGYLQSVDSGNKSTTFAPQTTKGDLISYDGLTQGRQPVGDDMTVLTADSTTAFGIRWGSLPVFGNEYQYSQAPDSTATTSIDFQDKLSWVTQQLKGGYYDISVSYSLTNVSTDRLMEVRVLYDGTVCHDNITTCHPSGDGSIQYSSKSIYSDWMRVSLSTGAHTLSVQYRNVDTGQMAISATHLKLYRSD